MSAVVSTAMAQVSGNSTVAAASAAAPATAAAATKPFSVAPLVYHIDVLLIGLIGLFILFKLPRAFARFWRKSEWTNGHLLWRSSQIRAYPRVAQANSQSSVTLGYGLSSSESHTVYGSQADLVRVNQKGEQFAPSYPPHVRSSPEFIQRLMSPLKARVVPGFSLGQLFLCIVWIGVLVYPALYKTTGPMSDPVRAGWIGASQVPFVFAFATKNNVLGAFLGVGYEKLNFLHRFVGRVVVLAINVHGVGYIYQWLIAKDFMETIAKPEFTWGLIGLISFDFLFVLSTSWVRKRMYNLFILSHIASFTLVLAAMWLHQAACHPYVIACVVLYGADMVGRVVKTRFTSAFIRPMPELGLTRVECSDINSGWRAGQHVRVRIMSSGMGLLGWSEVHPFTIASSPNAGEGLVLMCKKSGTWTKNLYNMANKGGNYEGGVGKNVSVVIEGPYGGPGHTMFASYSSMVLVMGGSGITFALSVLQDLVNKDISGECRVKVVELVWSVQDPASLAPLLPQFSSLISQCISLQINVSVFYTRAVVGDFPFTKLVHPGISLNAGRPKVSGIIEGVIDRTHRGSEDSNGLLLGVCGPIALADSASAESMNVDPLRKRQIGGIDFYEEVFGW